jgi:hypothetical protein
MHSILLFVDNNNFKIRKEVDPVGLHRQSGIHAQEI